MPKAFVRLGLNLPTEHVPCLPSFDQYLMELHLVDETTEHLNDFFLHYFLMYYHAKNDNHFPIYRDPFEQSDDTHFKRSYHVCRGV